MSIALKKKKRKQISEDIVNTQIMCSVRLWELRGLGLSQKISWWEVTLFFITKDVK